MMKLMDEILVRISALPRALQWATYAAVAIVGFLVWDSTVRPLAQEWKFQGDDLVAEARKLASGGALAAKYQGISKVERELGPIDLPQAEKTGAENLHKAVNEVLAKHSVTAPDYAQNPRGRLTGDEAAIVRLAPGASGKQVTAIEGELKFDATLEQTIKVISELESRPEVMAVTSVRMLRDKNKKLKVRVTVETWVLTTPGGKA